MTEYCIELVGERRGDGSVCVRSDDLPMFSVVGQTEHDALQLALSILPCYLKANVPEFVELRPIRSARELISPDGHPALPAHIIARTRGQSAEGSESHG